MRGASDCYALGDVFANKSGIYDINVGGFAGESSGGDEVNRCFAKGAVIAQRSVSGPINAGGLVGKTNRNLTNSAALGLSITVTGQGTKNTGRVFGLSEGGTQTNNHAYNGMLIGESATYGAYVPGDPVTSGTGDTTKHGEDAHLGIFRSRSFWQTTTLNFSAANWIFTTVEGRGYPILRGSPNGPALGGQ